MNSIASADFCQSLEAGGLNFFTGVPCSIFNPLYRELKNRPEWRYVPAPREDSAVGIAVGAYMAGRKPVVVMQNSGLGYSLNAFTSLVLVYEIPLLVLISWRGYKGKDAPEHIVMGAVMMDILRDAGLECIVLGEGSVREELAQAAERMKQTSKPVFLAVREGVIV